MSWGRAFRRKLDGAGARDMAGYLQAEMVDHLQRSCHHELAAARICWALADRAGEPRVSVLFEGMALSEKRRMSRQARELAQIGVPLQPDRDPWLERVWRWVLVELGPAYAMRWIQFVKRSDLRFLMQLRHVMKTYQYDENDTGSGDDLVESTSDESRP